MEPGDPSRYRAIPEVEPLDPMHPDPLLEHNSLAAAQVHRSPCIQNFLEQEAQRNDTESLESNISNKESPVSKDFQRDVEPSPVKKVKKFNDPQALVDVTSHNPAAPSRDQYVPWFGDFLDGRFSNDPDQRAKPIMAFWITLCFVFHSSTF